MIFLRRIVASPNIILFLGIAVFVWTWFLSLILQLWVIPHFFSHAGSNEGLVILDSFGFHEQAKEKAVEISNLGWSAWELRPYGQSPVGFASAFYVFFGTSPQSFLPFNALVHALSACVVLTILKKYFSIYPSLIGALIFVLNPASFEWVAQIHRDGIFILGTLLFILGWINFFDGYNDIRQKNIKYFLRLSLIFIIGILVIWVGRPYWIQITIILTIFFGGCLLCLRAFDGQPLDLRRISICLCIVTMLVFFQLLITSGKTVYTVADVPGQSEAGIRSGSGGGSSKLEEGIRSGSGGGSSKYTYQQSDWLPWGLEKHVYKIAEIRGNSLTLGGNTLVDASYRFDSLMSFLSYFPRALQIGLLSPLPDLWVGQGSTPAMTAARKIMGPVTVVFYFSLVGAVMGVYFLRKRPSFWITYLNLLLGILVFAVLTPNVGTLIRYRYGFYMLLVAIGVAVWCEICMKKTKGLSRLRS